LEFRRVLFRSATAIAAMERELAVQDLAGHLNALADAQSKTPTEIARALGFTSGQMRTILEGLGVDVGSATEAELKEHFDNVVGEFSEENRFLEAMAQTNAGLIESITHNTQIIETNLWLIGGVLVDILEQLGGTYGAASTTSMPGQRVHTGTYSSQGSGEGMAEVRAELQRISRLVERGNTDRRDGLGAVVQEERTTRRSIRESRTVRTA